MAKHNFIVGFFENGIVVGAQCAKCGQIALYENGKVPDDIREQDCKGKEDASQAAVRIVREATKD